MFTASRVVCACKNFPALPGRTLSGFPAMSQSFKVHHLANSPAASSTSRCTRMSSDITDPSGPRASTMTQFKWSGGVEQVLQCSVDAAWTLLADFVGLGRWASGSVSLCEQRDEGHAANAVGCVRYCEGSDGSTWVHERLLHLDPAARYMSYRMEDNHFVFPQGFQGYVAKFQLEDAGEGKTRVKWTYEVDPVATQSKENLTNFMVGFYTLNLQYLEAGANKLVDEDAAGKL